VDKDPKTNQNGEESDTSEYVREFLLEKPFSDEARESEAARETKSEAFASARFFHSPIFSDADRECILNVYTLKVEIGEITFSGDGEGTRFIQKQNDVHITVPEDGHAAALDAVATLYHAQKCAFEDILTRQGFDIVTEVPGDYMGRIAALSRNGTLIMGGKLKGRSRHMTSSRIYALEDLMYKSDRGYFAEDLSLGERIRVCIILDARHVKPFPHTPARGLAINPRGADGDELEEMTMTSWEIHTRTMELLVAPPEQIEVGGEKPEKKEEKPWE
jgi:hypothetical protein